MTRSMRNSWEVLTNNAELVVREIVTSVSGVVEVNNRLKVAR